MKKIFFALALSLIVYFAVEVLSFFGLLLLKKTRNITYQPVPLFSLEERQKAILKRLLKNEANYLMYSSSLGWTTKPNGFDGMARSNSQGIRADREFQMHSPDNKVRISAFGDSFTHSNDVSNEDTWAAKLERKEPRIEVLNFGVSGYGSDQAFFRYQQDGIPFKSHVVLIGYLSENILRNVNAFRPFLYPNAS